MSLIQYFDNNERYADLINGFVFCGQQVVSGIHVKESDSRKIGKNRRRKPKRLKYRQRYRDFVRKTVFGLNCVVIAVENQNLIHYAMPIRVMDGDALEYDSQLKEIQNQHRIRKDLSDQAEFLGGFSKADKVSGVVSLVIYYGKEPWDGARDLYELLDLSGIPDPLKKLVNHYPIHILDVRRFAQTEWFRTDLREVFEMIQCAEDKEKMKEFVELRKERLMNMAEDACDVIAAITNVGEIPFKDDKYRTEEGGINMCKALDEWGAEERAIGHAAGHAAGRREARREDSLALFQYGMAIEEVASVFNLELKIVQEWHGEWKKAAFADA